MRVKNIRIAIRSTDELSEELKEAWNRIDKGKRVRKHDGIYFENLEAMRKVLTEERLWIIKTVKKTHPSSIYQLAKILGRDIKNTYDDVQFLAEAGFMELERSDEGRDKTTPVVNYDKILLEIAIQ